MSNRRRARIVYFGPARPWYRPGGEAEIQLVVEGSPGVFEAGLELLDGATPVAEQRERFRLGGGGRVARRLRLRLPEQPRHGYGLRSTIEGPFAGLEAQSAVEALDGWWESPRHVAITNFARGADVPAAVDRLARWHVTVAQFYDWMYRHYRYRSPQRTVEFVDALGRRVSQATVRRAVVACRRQGIASLAYGSVYGAEREYAERHPSELLRAPNGSPLSLGETFYITDLRPGSWRARLLHQYEIACRDFGFDGVHMDQYGDPHNGIASDGSVVELEHVFPELIAEAHARVARLQRPRKLLFNCVGGWPLERVAGTPTAATYVELWPPDTRYADVIRAIDRARTLAPDKQVVIAAYPSVLAGAKADEPAYDSALEALLLLDSLVLAGGAYHHVLAEGDRVITGGYYPDARPLTPDGAEELRLGWQFSARYVHLLSDRGALPASIELLRLECEGTALPVSPSPVAGTVFARATRGVDGCLTLNLVDLCEQASDAWDEPRAPARQRVGWRLLWPGTPRRWSFASPWTSGGACVSVAPAEDGWLPLPPFRRWALLSAG